MAASKPIKPAPEKSDEPTIVKEYLSGDFAARSNDFEAAATRFEEALAKNPDDSLLIQNAYKFNLLSGKYDKAASYADKYLQHDPHATGALLLLAIKAASDGDFTKASGIMDGILPSKTKEVTEIDQLILPFVRMWIIAGEGNFDVALNMLDPRDSKSLVSGSFIALQKALLLSISGNNEDAMESFAILTSKDVLMPYNLAKSAATFYEANGKWEDAARVYALYKKQHPSIPHFEDSEAGVKAKTKHGLYIQSPKEGLAELMKETSRLMFSNKLYN